MAQFIIGNDNYWIDDDVYMKHYSTSTPEELMKYAIPYSEKVQKDKKEQFIKDIENDILHLEKELEARKNLLSNYLMNDNSQIN